MNQGKLDAVKVGDDKSEHWHIRNQWTKMEEWANLIQMTIITTTVGKNPF